MKFVVKPQHHFLTAECTGRCAGNCLGKCGSLGTCFCPLDR